VVPSGSWVARHSAARVRLCSEDDEAASGLEFDLEGVEESASEGGLLVGVLNATLRKREDSILGLGRSA
jgi:hypothetical protein